VGLLTGKMADMHLQTTLLVASMRRAGVRLLVLDFDQTLVSLHTRGKWSGLGNELGKHVRPFFLELVPVALRKGLAVSVATLSPQRRVVQHALAEAFGPTVARQILVRCLDGSWTPALECEIPESWRHCSRRGKAEHVLSVVSKIYAARSWSGAGEEGLLEPGNVCIIDDDVTTVKQARLDGMAAFMIAAHEVPERSLDLSSQLGRDMLGHYRCKTLAAASSALPLDGIYGVNKRARSSNPQSDDFGAAELVICDAEAEAQSAAQAAPRQRTRGSPGSGSTSADGAEPSASAPAGATGAASSASAAESPSAAKLAAEIDIDVEHAPPPTHVFKVARGRTGWRRSSVRRLDRVVDGCCTM
jgi:hypothetical protein